MSRYLNKCSHRSPHICIKGQDVLSSVLPFVLFFINKEKLLTSRSVHSEPLNFGFTFGEEGQNRKVF